MTSSKLALAAALLLLARGPVVAGLADGLRVLRRFEPVPGTGITHACVVEADPAYFRFSVISALKAAGEQKAALPELRRLLPGPALIVNAGFFSLKDGAPIGEFVEDGARPGRVIFAPGKNLDRIFVSRYDDSVDVLDGREKLTDMELLWTRSAVTGKSAWPGHESVTNRTALCFTRAGKVLLAAVYPLNTLDELFNYMKSEGCEPGRIVALDGGGSTQMSYSSGGETWSLGWERAGDDVPECHLRRDNADPRCYRPVSNFIVLEPRARIIYENIINP